MKMKNSQEYMTPKPDRETIQKLLMDRETYNALEHQIPYIFSIQSNSHNLVYYTNKRLKPLNFIQETLVAIEVKKYIRDIYD